LRRGCRVGSSRGAAALSSNVTTCAGPMDELCTAVSPSFEKRLVA
jgi:hypothetical protein